MIQITGAFVSERGQRKRNEDRAAWQPSGSGDYIAIVADGMGGGADGDFFSNRAVSRMMSSLLGTPKDADLQQALIAAVESTAADLLEQRLAKPEYSLSGSTLCAAIIRPVETEDSAQVWLAWVGDSRIYRVERGGMIELLTEDHVYARQLREEGKSQSEADAHPEAARLTSSLGDRLSLEPRERFFATTTLGPGDRLLLCSDGVSKVLDPNRAELTRLIVRGTSEESARAIANSALANGSRDNVTALVVSVAAARRRPGVPLIASIVGLALLLLILAGALIVKPDLFAAPAPTSPPVTSLATTTVQDTASPTSVPTLGAATSTAAPSTTPDPTPTPTDTPTSTPTRTTRPVTRTPTNTPAPTEGTTVAPPVETTVAP
ncbi:serine/threonine-protein phosphatase, partial [Oscillochloris sp. ZM17-4]|uniref:PP2C family protein-serine/threonine phosphatase n=1 Tax=Oscillochloris sp. ZM17-4 TaxID=2866714 RepID=UPI001C730FC2